MHQRNLSILKVMSIQMISLMINISYFMKRIISIIKYKDDYYVISKIGISQFEVKQFRIVMLTMQENAVKMHGWFLFFITSILNLQVGKKLSVKYKITSAASKQMPPTKDRMLLYRQITDIVSLRFGLICLNFLLKSCCT